MFLEDIFGWDRGRRQTKGGEPIGSLIFLSLQKFTIDFSPSLRIRHNLTNLTSPKLMTIS